MQSPTFPHKGLSRSLLTSTQLFHDLADSQDQEANLCFFIRRFNCQQFQLEEG